MQLVDESVLQTILTDKIDDLPNGQVDVASQLDLDASTINRSLNGEIRTPYTRYRAIWKVLKGREEARQESVKSLTVEEITWAHALETRTEAADKMQDNDFSQLPVKADGEAVGWVTDFNLMENSDPDRPVSEIGGKSMITVSPNDSRELIEVILEEGYPAVLVEDDGEYEGIITRFDLL